MSGLVEKLEAAEVGSQMLSAFVMQSVRAPEGRVEQSPFNGRWCVYNERGRLLEDSSHNGWWREGGWEVTTSIDAALALVPERVFWSLKGPHFGIFKAAIYSRQTPFRGVGRTAPLAVCIAALKAHETRALNLNETRHD